MPTIKIQNQTFIPNPCGALFWKEKEMLLVADVHFGKVSHFRKHGSAVPQKAIAQNFKQLDKTIASFQPKVICFLGDLFHSALNKEWNLFEAWVQYHSALKIVLIVGNHDIISPLKYKELGVHIIKEWIIDSLLFTHHPEEREGHFNLCGHIHPGILLSGVGRQKLRLPCFFKSKFQLILPAFGTFTGTYILEPEEEDEVYVLGNEEVLLVPNP